jgi:uncharacterized membrane protein
LGDDDVYVASSTEANMQLWCEMLAVGELVLYGVKEYVGTSLNLHSLQFCCELKTSLKNKVYFLKRTA